jgi:hypothetical protein
MFFMNTTRTVKRFTVNQKWRDYFAVKRITEYYFNNMNKAAQALGRLGRGKPKRISQAERQRRRQRLAEARKLRWAKKRS